MYNEVITFISETRTTNKYGDTETIETKRTVFADLRSVGQSEFYQAQAVGLRPEIKFVLADYLDYQNEKRILYKPFNGVEEEYSVIRTYRNNNELEIVCRRGVDE